MLPQTSSILSDILAFGFGHIPAFAVLVGTVAVLGWAVGRAVTNRYAHERADALETAYTQALQDGYLIRRVVESTSDGLVVQSISGKIIWVNPAYCQMVMRTPEEMIGRNPLEFVMPLDQQLTKDQIDTWCYDPNDSDELGLQLRRNRRADGREFWNQINASLRTAPDGTQHFILACRDVTEQVDKERELDEVRTKLEYSVAHDDLTGIANRAALLKFTERELAVASETGRRIGMLRIDLDRFKEINDTFGHPAGDAVLKHMSNVFKSKLRKTDMVARVGGDEFVIVCPDIGILDDLEKIATNICRASARPFEWANGTLRCSASFGAALSEPGMLAPDDLMQHSDFALYETKRIGRGGVTTYSEELHQRHSAQMRLREEFARAVRADELTFHFQPTLVLSTGAISGFEALVRWQHPVDGLLMPDVILPIAQELGLMAEIDMCAMRAGLGMKAKLRDAGFADIRVGLNASAEGLLHPDYIANLTALVHDYGFTPQHVAVEVLETVMLDGSVNAGDHARAIADLHKKGFHTLLDDFGIGYAGLSHLAHLELSGVKIDRSLAGRVIEERSSRRIVRTVAELCGDLNLRLIAEGVETREAAKCLHDMGVDVIQGYWLSKPIPQGAVIPWLHNYNADPILLRNSDLGVTGNPAHGQKRTGSD